MIKINKLLVDALPQIGEDAFKHLQRESRYIGDTTAKALLFLGEVMSNPNTTYYIPDSPYGYRDRLNHFELVRGLVEHLKLNRIEFRRSDLSVRYDLYETFEDEYDMYLKLKGGGYEY